MRPTAPMFPRSTRRSSILSRPSARKSEPLIQNATVVVGRAEGGHGATVGETGSGQPGCNTVLRVRHLDLDPLRELPCRPAVHGRVRGRTDGSIRLRVTAFLMFSLALKGASTDVARIGRLASGAGRCRTTATLLHGSAVWTH